MNTSDHLDRIEAVTDTNRKVARWLIPALFVLGVLLTANLLISSRQADTIDKLDHTVARVSTQSDKVATFVDELRAPPSSSELARNAAVSRAVQEVPKIRSILCEQFPQATACR